MREELLKNNTIRKSHKNNLNLIFNFFKKQSNKALSKNDLKKEVFRVREINNERFGEKTLDKIDWRLKKLNLENLNKKNIKKKEVIIRDFNLKEFGIKFFRKLNERLNKLELKHKKNKEFEINMLRLRDLVFLNKLNKLKKKFAYTKVFKKSFKLIRDSLFLIKYFYYLLNMGLVFKNFRLCNYYKFLINSKSKRLLTSKNNIIVRILKKKLYYYLVLIVNGKVITVVSIGVLLKFFSIKDKFKKKHPKSFNLLITVINNIYSKFHSISKNKILVIDFADKNTFFFIKELKKIVFKSKLFILSMGLSYGEYKSKKYKSIKKRQTKDNVELYLKDLKSLNKKNILKKFRRQLKKKGN